MVFIILIGCSGYTGVPVGPVDIPGEPDLQTIEPAAGKEADSQRVLWGIWNISFDVNELTVEIVPVRDIAAHFDVTSMITPPACDDCLKIAVNSFDPVTRIIDVDVTLRNPYGIAGRDVRGILYTNDYGHELRNADEWTKLFDTPGGGTLNPFKAFAKAETDRIFDALAEHTENYQVYIPAPPNYWAITYAVTASWPGNCKEPYTIYDFGQDDPLHDYGGATAGLRIRADDWQDDIDGITLVAPEITGVGFSPFTYDCGNLWHLEITNVVGAPAGEYSCRVIASSTNSGETALYDYVTITITEPTGPVVIGIDPDEYEAGGNLVDVTVTGYNFEGPGAQVKLTQFPYPDISATNVVVVDPNNITCDISIPFSSHTGLRDVTVINGDLTSGTGQDLFEILCPQPFINEINPESGYQGGVYKDVAISGAKYRGDSEVVLKKTGAPDIVATNVVVDNYFLLHCDITIPPGAATGYYGVEVTNDCGETGTAVSLFQVTEPGGWARTWGDTDTDKARAVALDGYENIYVAGSMDNDDVAFLRKYDSDGDLLWEQKWAYSLVVVGSAVINGLAANDTEVYAVGNFNGAVDFNPGTGSALVTSNGGEDAFIVSIDSDGNYRHSGTWGSSTGDDYANAVDVQAANVYVTGSFTGTSVDFDPDPVGEYNKSAVGGSDIYLSQFLTSANGFLTASTFGGPDDEQGRGVVIDAGGDILVTGSFEGTADFDPLAGPGNIDNRTSNGSYDVFLIWLDQPYIVFDCVTWGGTGPEEAYDVAVNNNDYVFVTGYYANTVDFDPSGGMDNHTSAGATDAYISAFLESGSSLSYQWAQTWGGTVADAGYGIAAAPFMTMGTGKFEGTVDFNPDAGEDLHASGVYYDAYLTMFNENDTFLRARTWGAELIDAGLAIACTGSGGNIYVAGYFVSDVDFDPGPGEDMHTSAGLEDAFLSKFPADGDW